MEGEGLEGVVASFAVPGHNLVLEVATSLVAPGAGRGLFVRKKRPGLDPARGAVVGDRVGWAKDDEDIPKGAIGTVVALGDDGVRATVAFDGDVGAYNLKVGELTEVVTLLAGTALCGYAEGGTSSEFRDDGKTIIFSLESLGDSVWFDTADEVLNFTNRTS